MRELLRSILAHNEKREGPELYTHLATLWNARRLQPRTEESWLDTPKVEAIVQHTRIQRKEKGCIYGCIATDKK